MAALRAGVKFFIVITMKQAETSRRKAGRPASFDRDVVLEKAMLAFWESGYETTSINDLTAAMEITAPSLYAAFGDKKRLFLEAMRRYAGDPDDLAAALALAPTARDAVAGMIEDAATHFTGEATPRGCLLASATATGSKDAAEVRAAVAQVRASIRAVVAHRIRMDMAEGSLPPDTDSGCLADLAITVIQGLSVMARDGANREALTAVARASMTGWPCPSDRTWDRSRT